MMSPNAYSLIKMTAVRQRTSRLFIAATALAFLMTAAAVATGSNVVGASDSPLEAWFYSDASCLLTIGALVQVGNTVIDADVDENGSRMLIHCDTEDERRLTILARGDSLNTEQRAPLLTRPQIKEGELGTLAWLTKSGVRYTDDSAPRRYVVGGSVKLSKSPAVDAAGTATNSSKQAFASISGVLEPIAKSQIESMELIIDQENDISERKPTSIEDIDIQTTADAPVPQTATDILIR